MASEPRPVIWARLPAPSGAPARKLDYEAITAAAIEIADENGLDAVTMRNVANRLGRGAMSLYRHIASKDELFELMYDAALGELELEARDETAWREGLAEP